jgi:hypothetical protein
MPTATTPPPLPPGLRVTKVYFAVPGHYGAGPEFTSWDAAVTAARETIQRFEYRGQLINKASPDYHPRRWFQEDDILIHYSRAFVELRVTEPVQPRPGSTQESGLDAPALRWEVFHDGTIEACPRDDLTEKTEAQVRAATYDSIRNHIRAGVLHQLPQYGGTTPGGSVRDQGAWRNAKPGDLAEQITTYIMAGIAPVLFNAAVADGVRVLRGVLAEAGIDPATLPWNGSGS